MHSNPSSFAIKNILCETEKIFFSKNCSELGQMNAGFWINIYNKGKVTL